MTVKSPDTGNKVLASTITSASAGNNCAGGSTDPRCATSATVLVPGLTIALTANTASTTPGATVGYTVTVTNSGQTAQAGAVVTDSLAGVLSDASYNSDASATNGQRVVRQPGPDLDRGPGGGGDCDGHLLGDGQEPRPGDKLLVDKVTSAAAGSNCPAGGTDPRCSSSIPVLVPGLEIAASAGPATTAPGAVVHYTVTVTNSGHHGPHRGDVYRPAGRRAG